MPFGTCISGGSGDMHGACDEREQRPALEWLEQVGSTGAFSLLAYCWIVVSRDEYPGRRRPLLAQAPMQLEAGYPWQTHIAYQASTATPHRISTKRVQQCFRRFIGVYLI